MIKILPLGGACPAGRNGKIIRILGKDHKSTKGTFNSRIILFFLE